MRSQVGEVVSWRQVVNDLEYRAKQCGLHFLSSRESFRFAQGSCS